jgi:phosphoribulokinase
MSVHAPVQPRRSGLPGGRRPVMLAVVGDSAAGKTTLTRGLAEALGADRCVSVGVDDYHRHERRERADLPFTPLHPDGNHLDIMEQHLQLLATGQPVLKPVYDHATGTLTRPRYVAPREVVVVEGLHALTTRLARACFDVTVYLDPPEEVRHGWKVARDTASRGYTEAAVRAELQRREPESAAHIRPQRRWADIVVRFTPDPEGDGPGSGPLAAELLLRPTATHPDLRLLSTGPESPVDVRVVRDEDGTPVESIRIGGGASEEQARALAEALWRDTTATAPSPRDLGRVGDVGWSAPLAMTQLLLLHHLVRVREQLGG